MMEGKIVILSGPSGVGKDTVIDAWRNRNPRVKRVVAYTTRLPRPGETNGVDYHFVTVEQFQAMVEDGAFLEYKEVHGNFYATPLRDLDRMVSEGFIAILKVDVQGALVAMDARPEAISIFLLPPSVEELDRRIRGRGTDDPEVIEKRLRNAHDELAQSEKYEIEIVNEDVGEVVGVLEQIVG